MTQTAVTAKIDPRTIDTLTRKEIIEHIQKDLPEDKANLVSPVFTCLLNKIIDTLSNKQSVMLKSVGTFSVVHKASRKGVRNPKTGEELVLDPRYIVTLNGTKKIDEKLITSELVKEVTTDVLNLQSKDKLDVKSDFVQTCLYKFIDLINSVEQGTHRIELRGFGVFSPTFVKAKKCRNPKTGESVWVDSKFKVSFKLSSKLRKKLNA